MVYSPMAGGLRLAYDNTPPRISPKILWFVVEVLASQPLGGQKLSCSGMPTKSTLLQL